MKEENWNEYLSSLLTKSNVFQLVKSDAIDQTVVEIYGSKNANNKLFFTIGYIENNLLYLNISCQKVPGYTKHHKGEYFFGDHFDIKRQSKIGLTFDEINKKGIREILEVGLHGQEKQYLLNNKVIYSILYINDYRIKVDFTNRTFWQRIFGPKIQNINGIKTKIIKLDKIFSGI